MKSVIIVAAGSSVRFGKNKLNEALFDKPLLQHAVDIFCGIVDEIILVGDVKVDGVTRIVEGGATRSLSVQNGLNAVSENCSLVAVHDGARPFVSKRLVEKLFEDAEAFGSAVPRLPVTDTLWQNGNGGYGPQNRADFFTVQTPQVFDFKRLRAAYFSEGDALADFTDESTLFCKTYGSVHFVEGEHSNKKITVPADLPSYRIGNGFDVHAFGDGNCIVLGGERLPFGKKLVGHSDADVLTHAVCDAVLAASGNRDIGVQFPDTDDRYLGADSMKLLRECVRIAQSNGFFVQNVSAVVICQQPKIAPHIDCMSRNLASVLQVPASCVNLSATTTENLGALGNGDGIASQATALLAKYN
ncbi:MAG: 2-C-methyl-D-erythritol 2,4-cyclodiphosphate synthase [Corallococcus sp.]|nr:2-C-methyl-D-erythritol 2,4-cyclodiphosphate synthase [Corallococcus sp.]MCM1359363.1 2-C-methyl-D-erythritol 2,4-cyclodiphosphate synthase [Corallococcus sp.]MCM1394806.1 2-C-methyl-D-erythritol 2,4-cyclodiphosphate synthase [Corallococcus sp.]